ncbi:MAG: PQQ-binding-like beta-propeller repeat protein [Thermoleophilia bacterium]
MRIARPGRRGRIALGAIAAVCVAGAGLGAWGLRAGWFDTGSIEGSTTGFVPAAGPQTSGAARSWPQYGMDPQRTRANTELRLDPPYRRLWRLDAGSLVEFPPVIGNDRVVVGTNGKLGICLDLRTGRVLWRTRLNGSVASSPAMVHTRERRLALFTMVRGGLLAVDQRTGRRLWRMSFGSHVESSPLVIGDAVYIGTLDGRVMRISLRRRRVEWTARTAGDVKGSLAASGTNVVVGDYAGHVSAFDRATGRLVWRTTSPGTRLRGSGRFYAGPAVAYGRVFIGNVNGRMVALSARTGDVAWVRVIPNYLYSSAAVADRTVFVGSYDHHLYALDAVTGRVRWRFDAHERITGAPSVIGHLVWFSTIARRPSDGRTFALDVRTGAVRYTVADGRYTPAVAVHGTLVLTGVRTLTGLAPTGHR